MKYSKSFLESIAITIMLAELPADKYLKSKEISQAMGVSHSYLKKIANKLNRAEIIKSSASKNGGYTINKDINEINLYDIFVAVEGEQSFTDAYPGDEIQDMFISKTNIEKGINVTNEVLLEAENSLKNTLKQCRLTKIIPQNDQGEAMKIDWAKIIKDKYDD
ncbi:Rrf2 family transcriptional regulator [Fructilactobacillus vespulae]|uniref:RrF2 family transcriptional regulator n=1 Tax=Fructilactobacillus vespulae TaxID=1249630 RepID=UPI0039B4373B